MIERGYLLNLRSRKDRLEQYTQILKDHNITRRAAVDTSTARRASTQLSKYNVILDPCSINVSDYFSTSPGALGCFLSHVKIWDNLPECGKKYAVILEDDADPGDVIKLLENQSIGMFGTYNETPDVIQLNKRVVPPGVFLGTESYCLSTPGANKLLYLHDNPELFSKYNVPDPVSKQPITLNGHGVIWHAVDRFIEACSHVNIPDKYRVNIQFKRRIGLNIDTASSISYKPPWLMSDVELETLRASKKYKWW